MWHLQLKSNHLRLKKPIVNMQIPCNDYWENILGMVEHWKALNINIKKST
jgi:hypothetical protein